MQGRSRVEEICEIASRACIHPIGRVCEVLLQDRVVVVRLEDLPWSLYCTGAAVRPCLHGALHASVRENTVDQTAEMEMFIIGRGEQLCAIFGMLHFRSQVCSVSIAALTAQHPDERLCYQPYEVAQVWTVAQASAKMAAMRVGITIIITATMNW